MENKVKEPFERIGTQEEPIDVYADEILEAIAEGKSIKVKYAVIRGNLDISKIEDCLGKDEDGKSIIPGNIEIRSSEIKSETLFKNVTFIGEVSFFFSTFSEKADFLKTTFSESTLFMNVTFNANASFMNTILGRPYLNTSPTFRERISLILPLVVRKHKLCL